MWKEKKIALFFKEVFTKGMYLLLIPVGNLIYFYLNYKVEGNPFKFQEYQKITGIMRLHLFIKDLGMCGII